MTSQLTRIVALSALLSPAMANAVGFGEIVLQSRIGEALMAEVPILNHGEEAPVAACFSMLPLRGSDLPVVTAAKPRLIRRGQGHILQIVGSKPVNEPIFAIGLRAGCGYDIEREYVLMPEAPMALPQAMVSSDTQPPTRKTGRSAAWQAREGETLEDIADAQEPAPPAERQRLLDRLQKANPDLASGQPLAEGTRVRLPKRQPPPRPIAATPAPPPGRGNGSPAAQRSPRGKPPRQAAQQSARRPCRDRRTPAQTGNHPPTPHPGSCQTGPCTRSGEQSNRGSESVATGTVDQFPARCRANAWSCLARNASSACQLVRTGDQRSGGCRRIRRHGAVSRPPSTVSRRR